MVDVYVVTILVALVHLGTLANVEVRFGAVFFAAVVVLTILAAESFDPRLIWDALEEEHGGEKNRWKTSPSVLKERAASPSFRTP